MTRKMECSEAGPSLDGWPGMGNIPTPRCGMGLTSPNHMDWGGSSKEIAGWGVVPESSLSEDLKIP